MSSNKTFQEQYEILDEIGSGSYGVVCTCYKKNDNNFFAVKKALGKEKQASLKIEYENLFKLQTMDNTKHVVKLENYKVDGDMSYLVLELAEKDLSTMFKEPRYNCGLPSDIILDLNTDLNYVTRLLVDKKIAHRDIKPANILVFNNEKKGHRRSNLLFKVCDLGGSTGTAEKTHRTVVGTNNYWHPLIAEKGEYKPLLADLWSIGVTLFYATTGYLPFKSNSQDEYKAKVKGRKKDDIYCSVTKNGEYVYHENIKNNIHDIWFNGVMTAVIKNLLDDRTQDQKEKDKTGSTLMTKWNSMAEALKEAQIQTFFVPHLPKLKNTVYLNTSECFKSFKQEPLDNEIFVSSDHPAYLLSGHDVQKGITTTSSNCHISPDIPYFVLPKFFFDNTNVPIELDWMLSFEDLEKEIADERRIELGAKLAVECQQLFEQEKMASNIINKYFSKIKNDSRECAIRLKDFKSLSELIIKEAEPKSDLVKEAEDVEGKLQKANEAVNRELQVQQIDELKPFPIEILDKLVELKKRNEAWKNHEATIMRNEVAGNVDETVTDGSNKHDEIAPINDNTYKLLTKKNNNQLILEQRNCEQKAKGNNRKQANRAIALIKFQDSIVECQQQVQEIYDKYEKLMKDYIKNTRSEENEMETVIKEIESLVQADRVVA